MYQFLINFIYAYTKDNICKIQQLVLKSFYTRTAIVEYAKKDFNDTLAKRVECNRINPLFDL